MDIQKSESNSSQQELVASAEQEYQEVQRALHMDELSSKIDSIISHQHELLTLIRHASKTHIKFPIANEEQLRTVDHDLATDSAKHIPTLKSLLGPYGLRKNLSQVLGPNILRTFNYDGVNGMQCFKDFKPLNAAIFDAVKQNGYTEREYVADMRNFFRIHKNRIFKQTSDDQLRQRKQKNIVIKN